MELYAEKSAVYRQFENVAHEACEDFLSTDASVAAVDDAVAVGVDVGNLAVVVVAD